MDATREVGELDLPTGLTEFLSESWNIRELYPPQAEAMPCVLAGKNTLLAIPTASGKSLVAYLAIMQKLLVDEVGSRAIYIVPLKALASEKYEELTQLAEHFNLRVGLGIGDRDGEARNVGSSDIIVCTSEKLDSLMRTRPELIHNVSIVVADEFHLIHDGDRGPTMEVNLARLRHWRPSVQIIALSATVGNPEELAQWLGAELFTSNWRPVTLEMSTMVEGCIEARKRISAAEGLVGKDMQLPPPRQLAGPKSAPTWCALLDTVEAEGQIIVFVSTRRSAQSEARKLAKRLHKYLEREDPERLKGLAAMAEKISGQSDSSMGDVLISSIRGGVAFHHAGLTSKQRKLVESGFKQGLIAAIIATPTLAAGINLPARRVLLRDLKRWDGGMSRWLSVMEVQQMLGRAGRPRYDTIGEAWLLCKGSSPLEEADLVAERYIEGKPEKVISKLAADPPMRVHLLAGIATGGLNSRQSIRSFFASTFLGHTQPRQVLEERIDNMLAWLVEEGFIIRSGVDEKLAQEFEKLAEAEAAEKIAAAASGGPGVSGQTGSADSVGEQNWDDEIPAWVTSAKSTTGVDFQSGAAVAGGAAGAGGAGGASDATTDSAAAAREVAARRRGTKRQPHLGFRRADDLELNLPIQVRTVDELAMTYQATGFGNRASQLYIDPLSAATLRTGLRRAVRRIGRRDEGQKVTDFGLIFLAASTPDFVGFWARDSERDALHMKGSTEEEGILDEIILEDRYLGTVKSSWVLEMWSEESPSREIEQKLGITPGDLRHRIELMEWLLYSARELVDIDDIFLEEHRPLITELMQMIDVLRNRIRHGCRADLLDLVRMKNIGRTRARTLEEFGVRTPKDLLELNERDLARLSSLRAWGPILVDRIITNVRQVLGKTEISKKKRRDDDQPLSGERVD
jgi:helicase